MAAVYDTNPPLHRSPAPRPRRVSADAGDLVPALVQIAAHATERALRRTDSSRLRAELGTAQRALAEAAALAGAPRSPASRVRGRA